VNDENDNNESSTHTYSDSTIRKITDFNPHFRLPLLTPSFLLVCVRYVILMPMCGSPRHWWTAQLT